MARQIKSLTDLSAQKLLQKKVGTNIVFEVSDTNISASIPLTASALVSNSTISGSGRLTAGSGYFGGDVQIMGNMLVSGALAIINTDVLEVKDNIVVINKLSGSSGAYDASQAGLYINRGNNETGSFLWVSSSNDYQFGYTTNAGGTTNLADLKFNKAKINSISGSAGVDVDSNIRLNQTASLHTSASFTTLTGIVVNGGGLFNIDQAFHAIDDALTSGTNNTKIVNAYNRLRHQITGAFDASGNAIVILPKTKLGQNAFPATDLNYVMVDVATLDTGVWVNDLLSVQLKVSGTLSDELHVVLDAPALGATDKYRLIAENYNTASYALV
jgi:hypothetical protein